jgi:hypothetical protein
MGIFMSMHDYEAAKAIMQQYSGHMDFMGACDEETIELAERELNVKMPQTYRRFLSEFGAGSFGGEEFYGIISSDFSNSTVPDAVWSTIERRRQDNFPSEYIEIYSVGTGEIFCLDTAVTTNSEAPVVAFEPGLAVSQQGREIIARDFGDFLLQKVQEEVRFLQEDSAL